MIGYCSVDKLRRIRLANSYPELLAIAIEILTAMHNENPWKPIAMVCGPISTGGKSSRQKNLEVFSRAIDRISADGLLIFSQMPFEDDMDRIYKSDPSLQGSRLLREFYLPIFEMGGIELLCFLPGWEKSVGANWEHNQAKRLGIPVLYLAESYIAD